MYLRDLAVYADPRLVERWPDGFVGRFHHHTGCIVEHILALIARKVKTTDVAKLNFTFAWPYDVPVDPPRPLPTGNLWWPFAFNDYVAGDDKTKKQMILHALTDALLWTACAEGWPSEPFADARREIERLDLVFQGQTSRSWVSPDRRHRVKVHFQFELDRVVFHAVLLALRSPRELGRVFLGEGIPESDCVRTYIGHGAWTSPTTFQLTTGGFFVEIWQADFAGYLRP